MKELRCHSGTKKDEVIDFVNTNKGIVIEAHYESNLQDVWGDDYVVSYDTSLDREFLEMIQLINTHYIHNIRTVE